MKNYEMFKEEVVESIIDYMSQKNFKDAEVNVRRTPKNNKTLDGLSIIPKGYSGAVPVIYINHLYEDYCVSGDFASIMRRIAGLLEQGFRSAPDYKNLELSPEKEKQNIVLQLINTEKNQEMLKDVPNRSFHDLSIVYRIAFDDKHSAMISNQLAENMQITEEELFALALENTKKKFPTVVKGMNEIIQEMMGVFFDAPDEDEEELLYVFSNEKSYHGAVAMLYDDVLEKLADKLESDLYILPSSIHELIATPFRDNVNPCDLISVVKHVNGSAVAEEDRLSDNIYHYSRETHTVTLIVQ